VVSSGPVKTVFKWILSIVVLVFMLCPVCVAFEAFILGIGHAFKFFIASYNPSKDILFTVLLYGGTALWVVAPIIALNKRGRIHRGAQKED
jgi:hypothetical protein